MVPLNPSSSDVGGTEKAREWSFSGTPILPMAVGEGEGGRCEPWMEA